MFTKFRASFTMGLGLIAAGLLLASSSWAQVDTATGEALMRKSGLWQQLTSIAPQTKAGLLTALKQAREKAAPGAPQPSQLEIERMLAAASAAYSVDRMRAVCLAIITQGTDTRQLAGVNRWYDSELGRQITRLEVQASEAGSEPTAGQPSALQAGAALLESLPSTRRALLNEIVETTRSAETIADITIATALAVQEGVRSAQPGLLGPPMNELKAALQAQRPQMVQAFAALSLASNASTYRTLDSPDLRLYADFLRSDAGRHFNALATLGFVQAIVDASAEFGRQLPSTRGAAKS